MQKATILLSEIEQVTYGAVLEAEVFEAGNEVFVVSGEDRVPAPVGEHLLADGRVLVIAEEGVIAHGFWVGVWLG